MKGEKVAESYLLVVEDPAHPNVAVNMRNISTVLTWFIRNGQAPPTRHRRSDHVKKNLSTFFRLCAAPMSLSLFAYFQS